MDCDSEGVSCIDLADTDLLDFPLFGFPDGYNHFGDITWHNGFVFVPIESSKLPSERVPGIAVFRGDKTLEFLDHELLPEQLNSGWAAVDPEGVLYGSTKAEDSNFHNELRRYRIDWDLLTSERHLLELEFLGTVALLDETGGPLELEHMQGGVFSEDEPRLLYLINGFYKEDCDACGIHVFEVTGPVGSGPICGSAPGACEARRVARSQNGTDPFNYEYNPGRVFNAEEPEGITYWDLDAIRNVPGETSSGSPLGGQLHAILLDNDYFTSDDVYLKHYRVECDGVGVGAGTQDDRIP